MSVRDELLQVLRLMVDEPRAVRVAASRRQDSTIFRAQVAQSDLGKVIGRQGRTARSLRALLELRGEGDDHHYGLDIRES